MRGSTLLALLASLLILLIPGCGQLASENQTVAFEQVRKMEIASGVYPNIISANSYFYIIYETESQQILVRKYDTNLSQVGSVLQLISSEGTDHQTLFIANHFYLVNSYFIRKFAANWLPVATREYYAGLPSSLRPATQTDGSDDMLFGYANESLYLGLPLGETSTAEIKEDRPDNLYLQKYNQDLLLISEFTLEAVGNAPATSLLYKNGQYYLVCGDRHWDDSSLIVKTYDGSWNLSSTTTISAVSGANEEFPMGFIENNGVYYIAYNHITGDLRQPSRGSKVNRRTDIMLKAFAANWDKIGEVMVTGDVSAENTVFSANAAHLAIIDSKIYIVYDSDEDGTKKIYLKEFNL